MRAERAIAMFAVLAVSTGCSRSEGHDRSEAAHVLRALEAVRAAPNEGKRRPADELAHQPCTSPIVCGARDSCAEAYQHLARGTEVAQRVKTELDRLDKADVVRNEEKAEISNELDHAGDEINKAHESLPRCEEAATLMRRTFGI